MARVEMKFGARTATLILLAWMATAGWPDSIDHTSADQVASDANNRSDIQFALDDSYLFDGIVEVQIANTGNVPYLYNSIFPACFLSYQDHTGSEFLIPPGTHCDQIKWVEITPGETVTLFTWGLNQCLVDTWGCFYSRPLPPGQYTISGQFESSEGNLVSEAEASLVVAHQGDANCDQDVDALDALVSLRVEAGLGANAACLKAVDVDCSQSIDAVDALLILKHVASLLTDESIECAPPGYPRDSDDDGVLDVYENQFGSDPENANSTPEYFMWLRETCSDGVDNDLDLLVDSSDTGPDGPSDPNSCAGDLDGDGIINPEDNCPLLDNPEQIDENGDGVGDTCEWQWWFI